MISLFQEDIVSSDSLNLYTDAYDILFGGVFDNKWFTCQWPESFTHFHINMKEAFAIFAAISTWGHLLHNKQILFFCDNMAVVSVWNSGSCKDTNIMKVIRALFFTCASHNINILTKHIAGSKNNLADALSRSQVQQFHINHPTADKDPSPIPDTVWHL